MRRLTESQKERLWEEVRREFPDDKMMQEIHYVRLLHHFQTKDMSSQERIKYFELEKKKQA
jgi:predicted house-cleaning noncanonical NTP pyrophosphatase (MazG superfamily)